MTTSGQSGVDKPWVEKTTIHHCISYFGTGVSIEEVGELPGDVGAGYDVNVRAQGVVRQAVLSS